LTAKLNTASISGGSEAAPQDAAQAADIGMFGCHSGDHSAVPSALSSTKTISHGTCAKRTANRFRHHKDVHHSLNVGTTTPSNVSHRGRPAYFI
jgi:hypothetical protein